MLRVLSASGIVGVPAILASSFAALSAHTGTAAETVFWTVTLPAGTMGANGILRFRAYFSAVTSSGNLKTIRVRMGAVGSGLTGSALHTAPLMTTVTQIVLDGFTANRNAQNSQYNSLFTERGTDQLWTSISVVPTSRDTSQAQDIVITGQLATAGETLTPDGYIIELTRAS